MPGRAARLADLGEGGRHELEHFCKRQARAVAKERFQLALLLSLEEQVEEQGEEEEEETEELEPEGEP